MMEMLNDLFDDDMTAMAINIAMKIETGTIDYDYVIDVLGTMPDSEFVILFWQNFNDMTRNALNLLYTYAARKYLENCWEIS